MIWRCSSNLVANESVLNAHVQKLLDDIHKMGFVASGTLVVRSMNQHRSS